MTLHRSGPRRRDPLEETNEHVQNLSKTDTQFLNMGARFDALANFAEVVTGNISDLKTRCADIEKAAAIQKERIHWIWGAVGVLAAIGGYFLKTFIEWRLAHP